MSRFVFQLFTLGLTMICGAAVSLGQDLIQAPADTVFYELSNMRSERGVTSDTIAFDYKRIREGKGKPRLAVRTDQGPVNISGFGFRIGQSGTIRLQDQLARVRSIINQGRGEIGFEFYFTTAVDLSPMGHQFLISNSVTRGPMTTKLQARPPSAEEIALKEMERKSKIPPETVPAGYVRSDASTEFIPGAPVMVGRIGEWKAARVVSISSQSFINVVLDVENRIVPAKRDGWLAVSETTLQQMRDNPGQFSISLRTLPGGKLVLDNDAEALHTAVPNATDSLVKGTPLLLEHFSGWKKVFFLSASGIDANVVIPGPGRPREERVEFALLAIRKQTVNELQDQTIARGFEDNVADYRPAAKRKPSPSSRSTSSGAPDTGMSVPNTVPFPGMQDGNAKMAAVTRTWKDQTGKFSIDATMDRKTDEQVFLKKADGTVAPVPIAKLSEADQEFLQRPTGPLDYRIPLKGVFGRSELSQNVKSVAISPDNRLLLMGRSGASASLIELSTGRVLIDSDRMRHMGDIEVCGFTPNGKFILLCGDRGVVEVYAMDDKGRMNLERQFAGHTRGVTSMSISHDSRFALTGGDDDVARYWEIATGREIKTLPDFDGKVKATCISPSGKRLMATDGKTVKILDADQGATIQAFPVGKSHASGQSAAFAPNGLLLAVGDTYAFRLWNLETQSELPELQGKEIGWSAVFSPDSRHLITGGNGVLNIWDAKTQSRLQSFPVTSSFYVQAVGVNSDGSLIVCPAGHRSVGIYQASRE